MGSFLFWKNWEKGDRILYLVLGALFIISVILFIISLITGADAILGWESLMQSEAVKTIVDTVERPPFTIPVVAESYTFLDFFNGTDIEINRNAYYLFMFFVAMGFVFLLSVITYLPRFWYMVATGLFVVVLIFFKLELLLLFESTSKLALILTLVLYLPLSYYFHSFNKNASLYIRVISFSVITLVFALLVGFASDVPLPFMLLAINGMPVMLIIAVVFTILVAHDIVAGFLNAVSSDTSSVGNWKHFFIITGIYLLNILIIYLNATGAITWDILPVNVFVLLLISTLVGIWGYRQREPQYDYLFPFKPLGAIFYLSLATITFTSIGFFHATGNDPLLDVIQDIVIYSHLGYGFVFIMYIAANFLSPLTRGMPISRVLYKPGVMPYFTYRFAGIIAFGALLFLENWELPVEKTFAGYYNGLGDLHTEQGDLLLANGYYLQGSQYGYSNHRSNYSLALNAYKEERIEKAVEHYNRSNYSWPTEYSFINLSNLYMGQDRYFDALFSLKEGLRKFPDSGPIMNNLGLLYAKIDVVDSSIYYLEKSYERRESRERARNNLLAVLAKSESEIDLTEEEWLVDDGNAINISNAYAYYNSTGRPFRENYPGDLEGVNQFIHTSVYNYLVNNLWRPDTLSYALADSIYGSNIFLDRRLILGEALNRYYKGEVSQAFGLMDEIRIGDLFWTGDMNYLIGLWNLENLEDEFAVENMELARDNYNRQANYGLAVAYTLAGDIEKAIDVWDSVSNSRDTRQVLAARKILPILKETDTEVVKDWNDEEIYRWVVFHRAWDSGLENSINSDNFKAAIDLQHTLELIEEDKLDMAAEILARAEPLNLTDQNLGDRLTSTFLEISARTLDIASIKVILDGGFVPPDPVDRDHYHALIFAAEGDTVRADELFSKWEFKNPFKEGITVSASRFYESIGDWDKAYDWLQNAGSLNSNSLYIQKNYIRICGILGYELFGRYVLDLIKDDLTAEEYGRILTGFEADLSARYDEDI